MGVLRAIAIFPNIPPENLKAFQEIANHMLESIGRVDSILRYDIYFDASGTRCIVLEEYRSAAGVIEHVNLHAPLLEELTKLGGKIEGSMFPLDESDADLELIRSTWDSQFHSHFGGK